MKHPTNDFNTLANQKANKNPAPFSLRLSFDERGILENDAAGMALGAYIRVYKVSLTQAKACMMDTEVYYYQYHIPDGTVGLIPEAGDRYKVMFNDENLGSYHSAEAAADDVSGGHTSSPSSGVDLGDHGIPSDLVEWDKKLFSTFKRMRPA